MNNNTAQCLKTADPQSLVNHVCLLRNHCRLTHVSSFRVKTLLYSLALRLEPISFPLRICMCTLYVVNLLHMVDWKDNS